MAKKKKRKNEKTKSSNYRIELMGILLLLISIIGFGRFGLVGNIISGFAIFLMGTWYNVLLFLVLLIAIYMIIKREKPYFLDSRLLGLYLVLIGVLIFSHLSYVRENNLEGAKIIKETIDNFMASNASVTNAQGGGIIGAVFSFSFVKLFDIKGTEIVTWALIIIGVVMFTGISIYDFVKGGVDKIKASAKHERERREKNEISKQEEDYETDQKIVVSSVDELIHAQEDEKISEAKEPVEINVPEVKESKDEVEIIDSSNYTLPSVNLLRKPSKSSSKANQEAIKKNVPIIESVLKDFQIEGKVVAANIGPSVTQYELEIKHGTKVSKILSINREIALALAAKDVRIQAPIPGKSTIGIEIPNKTTSMVTVREMLENIPKGKEDSKLLVVLGRDIMGKPTFMEINKTPHLLVAGSTGSGKSVCINSIITSILMRTRPDEVKLVLVDPKKVELSMYNGVPHLLAPVVTDARKANIALKKIVVEMERRYDLFSDSGTKNIAGYNLLIDKKNESLPDSEKIKHLPYIVVIIDELADLMLVAAKEVEDSIMRITQMARAAGIHLIVATQRPSTDVITGVVKSNIPSRISFAVSSGIDSRTILDSVGAEKLLGKGDMLFLPQGESIPIRIQGTYIDEEEIKAVVDHTISQQKAHYDNTLLMDDEEQKATSMVESNDDYEEPLYNEIVEFVVTQGKASASLLQRRFRLGYNRAARCIDLLEERGIIGPNNGSKPREVLVKLDKKEE
ncbi:MAG: cell division protein FtsK [Bacilli bacterium]|nr:cell division protein FtsK [Bacilli bacterium]